MKQILLLSCLALMALTSNAQFTVTIQPNECTGKDTWILNNYPTTNLGASTEFNTFAWTCGGSPCNSKALIAFDLSAIPSGAIISSATLSLFADLNSSNGYAGTPTYGTDNASYLNRVTSAWDEMTVTWNTTPTTTTTDQVLLAQSTSTSQDYLGTDITAFAQYWVQNPAQNYGMMIEMITSSAYNSLLFCSSDNGNSSKRPKLTVTYTLPVTACVTFQPDSCTGKDTWILNNYPTTNLGTSAEFNTFAWTCGGSPCNSKALIEFDLSTIPSAAVISSATLSLYADVNSSNGYAGTPTWGTDNDSYLSRVTSPWNEMSVTWNTTPTTTITDQVIIPQSTNTAQDYPSIDVTAFAQFWAQNPSQNYGMMIEMIFSSAYNSLLFCSSDNANVAKRPKLQVCFSTPTSIVEVNSSIDAILFPNPATNQLTINLGGLQAESVSIYNVDGRLESKTTNPVNNSIDVSGLAAGVYIAEVTPKSPKGDLNTNAVRVRWVKM